jgi:hypothetical protein
MALGGESMQRAAGMARNVARGEDPSVVAEAAWKAVASARPRLRYLAGRQAKRVRRSTCAEPEIAASRSRPS